MYRRFIIISLMSLFLLLACSPTNETEDEDIESLETTGTEQNSTDNESKVYSELINGSGEKIGMATFQPYEDIVLIHVNAWNLPEGVHGIHIHEVGKCEGPSFATAEGHFNPFDAAHGFNHPEGPHAGDLPNIYVQADGTVNVTMTANLVTLDEEEPNSLLQSQGTSLVIHEKIDDYHSQPAGDAGDRIACGVIEADA